MWSELQAEYANSFTLAGGTERSFDLSAHLKILVPAVIPINLILG
jgi:hypothetical protein